MARPRNLLSARAVGSISAVGRHADGGNLYLNVQASGAKSWVLLWKQNGRPREMGLGSARDVSLAAARELAAQARAIIAAGGDPLTEKRAKRLKSETEAASAIPTFGSFADNLIDQIAGGFRNAKHVDQWRMTLGKAYCESLRDIPIDQVSTTDVLSVLQPVWLSKSETAGRIRGRIERVLDAAKAKGFRQGENPARWRGHLSTLLPKRAKLQRGRHAAMPYADLPAFFVQLRSLQSVSAQALAFLILNASRTGEVIGARWSEVDLAGAIWNIPASRMKAGIEHRVPLTPQGVEILQTMAELSPSGSDGTDDYVFPSAKVTKPLSSMALAMCLRGLAPNFTVHGFRSSFRDWAAEETPFPREIAEQALAHVVGSDTERAYRRGDALEKRRAMMMVWATYISSHNSKQR